MRVAVVGAGGVGGYFGGRLAAAGTDVAFVARGAHLDALRASGLEVTSPLGDLRLPMVRATDDAAGIGPVDVVLFTVKTVGTTAAARSHLPALVGERTVVISLQNGVDAAEQLAAVVGAEHVAGGLALIFAGLEGPGRVAHRGGPAKLVVGELDDRQRHRLDELLAACRDAGVAVERAPDIRAALWDKLAFICAQAGTTTAARCPLGAIRATPETWQLFRTLVDEVYAVARAEGIDVAADATDARVAFAETLEAQTFSSLHDDLIAGRPLELDALHGAVLRRARRHGVAVPATAAIHAVLAPWRDPRDGRSGVAPADGGRAG